MGGLELPATVRDDPLVASLTANLWRDATLTEDGGAYGAAAVEEIKGCVGGEFSALVLGANGRWIVASEAGSRQPLPVELLAGALDRESAACDGRWIAVPLSPRGTTAEALVFYCAAATDPRRAFERLKPLGVVLGEALAAVEHRHQQHRRLGRVEAVLQIANQWNRATELEPLLTEMAQAATRLFSADRASIFLWDRATHTLVGRPALGVGKEELRIPDDRGVVGQVIRTGEARRVDAASEADQIDRHVDKQLGYRTRNLLCVPLRGGSGQLFGAFELINKQSGSFTAEDEAGLIELAAHAAVALENARDREQLLSTSRQLTDQAAQRVQLIGQSRAIEALRSVISRVADTELAVLILGENGTGKEVVAQSIHYLSRRRQKPFIAVNCAAIPDTLAESELFGHEKGAFTDAQEARLGKFELARDGTLFLDEIGDLSLAGQSKLLRVLEEKILVRVGGSKPIHTDARVLTATNQNLAEMVRQRRFREDLYFRLNVVTLEIPPLRERPEDIMLLADHFLADFCRKARRGVPQFSTPARKRLEAHPWPGNVRELRNLMERLAYLSTGDRIEVEDLAFILSPRGASDLTPEVDRTLTDATAEFQVRYIRRAIEQCGGNMSQAAGLLGLHRSNLYRKMRQLDMPIPD
jgi:Nif-specific regulatory protein